MSATTVAKVLCAVMNDTNMIGSSPLVAGDILDIYKKCDGLCPLNGQTDCLEVMVKEGNPAPVPPSATNIAAITAVAEAAYMWAHRDYSWGVTGVVLEAINIITVVAYSMYHWIMSYNKKRTAAKKQRMEISMSNLRREIKADMESTMRASMLNLLRGERPPQALRHNDADSEDDIKSDEEGGLFRKNAKCKGKEQSGGTSDNKASADQRDV